MLVVAIALAVIGMLLINSCVIVVPRDSAYIVERLGVYRDAIMAGLHVLAPFIDRIAFRYTLLPQQQELSDVCITEDNESVKVTSSYRWRIVDPRRFAKCRITVSRTRLVIKTQRRTVGAAEMDGEIAELKFWRLASSNQSVAESPSL